MHCIDVTHSLIHNSDVALVILLTARTKCHAYCRDKIILLNKTTEIINFWQDSETKKTVEEARAAFPDCMFQGSD